MTRPKPRAPGDWNRGAVGPGSRRCGPVQYPTLSATRASSRFSEKTRESLSGVEEASLTWPTRRVQVVSSTMRYEHLGLTRWPFPVVPEPRFCDFIADRQELRQDVDGLLRALSRQDTSSIHLLWSWYGAGKTHTLHYLANRAAQISKQGTSRLHTIYSEFPRSARSFVDLYRSFALGLNVADLIDAYLEISTARESERFQREMLTASPDLANGLKVLVTGEAADQVTAMRWLQGESLPISEFRRIGIVQKIGSSEEAGRIFSALVHLLALAAQSRNQSLCRVLWLLDEFQRVERLPPRVRDEISVGLHSTFNACPTGLTMILSFSGRPDERLPAWFSSELQDRIGRTKVLILPPLLPEEALDFVRDVLTHLRSIEAWDTSPYFPFTEATCRSIIAQIQQSEELKPRALMHALNAVLQEADPVLEAGEMQEISPEFAKRVLTKYVRTTGVEEI
jgi:hypothetical protein